MRLAGSSRSKHTPGLTPVGLGIKRAEAKTRGSIQLGRTAQIRRDNRSRWTRRAGARYGCGSNSFPPPLPPPAAPSSPSPAKRHADGAEPVVIRSHEHGQVQVPRRLRPPTRPMSWNLVTVSLPLFALAAVTLIGYRGT